jgi:phage protein D
MNSYPARRARARLLYNNKDITEDISRDLVSFTWTDKSSKEADDISIKLQNTHGKWSGDWQPAKGAKLMSTIQIENWNGNDGTAELPCGTFEIDETALSWPPAVVDIKAVSVPVTSKARGQAHTRVWNNVELSLIASDIAKRAGLSLMFDLPNDPHYQEEKQIEETDLSFLQGLAEEAGASLKVSHDKLILFDEAEYEKKPSVLTLALTDLISCSLKNKSSGIYKNCKVKYHDPETDEDIEGEADADPADLSGEDANDRTMEVNCRCKSIAEAEDMAKNLLHDANKHEVEGTITMPGDIRIVAGINVALAGLGRYDGKYAVDSVTHTVTKGYTVSANIRRGGKKSQGSSVDYIDWETLGHLGKDYVK